MGFKIFVHAVRLVIGHLGDALHIGGLLYVVQFGAALAVALLTPSQPMTGTSKFDPTYLIYFLPFLVIVIVTNIWIAVAWHRYVLLDEMPGTVMARFNGERMLAYFGNALRLFLVAIAIAIVVIIVATIAAGISRGADLLVQLAPLVIYALVAIPLYRLALILPASAVGKPIGLREAWSATAGATGTIVGLAILSVLCAVVLNLPGVLLSNGSGPLLWLGIIWQTLVGWIQVMVGVSILTTLYGYYVEHRAIA
jgi:hypothetical protein